MLKRPITYEDWDGNTVTESFYFNFTKAELVEMEVSEQGGLQGVLNRIIAAEDNDALVKLFKRLVLAAYGVRSEDGRRFIKSEELGLQFTQTPAYSALFMELATNADKAGDFVNGIMPQDMVAAVKAEMAKREAQPPLPPTAK